jgi:hypothetical protein
LERSETGRAIIFIAFMVAATDGIVIIIIEVWFNVEVVID